VKRKHTKALNDLLWRHRFEELVGESAVRFELVEVGHSVPLVWAASNGRSMSRKITRQCKLLNNLKRKV
jgi:hypothetical protein